jgi:catechol 2,3-dioxygenase-like lactoylglutathione lyase family enzyme
LPGFFHSVGIEADSPESLNRDSNWLTFCDGGAAGAGTSVYFRDPDGSLLEFLSYAGK